MQQAFDTISSGYDASFTHSIIGTAQRDIVRDYLEKFSLDQKKLNILELNCGTGEDALWFAKKGHSVLATDISEKMLEIVHKKIEKADLSSQIRTLQLDISKIENNNFEGRFDLIFSNFGGMNCISTAGMNSIPAALSKLLKPHGRLVMVIMPKYCLWETKYFLLKLNFKKAFRRYSDNGTIAKLNGMELRTFYYTLGHIKKIFRKYFNVIAVKPVGFFIPPSYLENFFASKNKIFSFIKRLESHISNWSILSAFSDHYIIDFRLK
ncbi:MAG: methyltransferase domain-containing protein [Ignavibacteriaceae bacterium]|jgi:ubiquinone/menaquinone biosynthesis C-methylase UbiE